MPYLFRVTNTYLVDGEPTEVINTYLVNDEPKPETPARTVYVPFSGGSVSLLTERERLKKEFERIERRLNSVKEKKS
jgi:hypothetical protein